MLDDDPRAYSYVLLLRIAIVNLVGFALLAAATLAGWTVPLLVGDTTGITALIAGVFAVGLGVAVTRAWRVSRELNWVRDPVPPRGSKVASYLRAIDACGPDSRSLLASSLKLKLASRIGMVRQFGTTLVLLGLIGTVVGFIIALSGVDPQAASDPSTIGPMVSILIGGMATVLNTTLVGSVLNIWLMVNFQLLSSGTVNLITGIIARGEAHGRA
ncbi:MAG: hypothetical protein EXQ94_09530 [Alphaproteobacteria bacterium]|nr:hypothetical protein [Alphaproteobacteria bacterium]